MSLPSPSRLSKVISWQTLSRAEDLYASRRNRAGQSEEILNLHRSDTLNRGSCKVCYESINNGAEVGGRREDNRQGSVDAAAVQEKLTTERIVRDLAFGIVNGILLSPVMVSFAALIFRDPAFAPHLPRLVKLVIFSAAVHMACVGSMSGLKFAVGSVQDAGLIFLSAMASMLVTFSREKGLDEAAMISTVCVMLSACTAMLGLALVFLGRLRLASLVQYLPMPVVGGYLAFIGYFCGQAGLAFATGLEITSVEDLSKLTEPESCRLVAPAVLGGAAYYLILRRFSSPMTLPLLLAMFVGVFFVILAATGTSLEEARALKWVSPESPMLPLTRAWDVFSLADVHWGAMTRVLPNFLAMTVVVAFSSCLDVAAIEMEMKKPLDFDRELQIVGWSNVLSGLLGGFTGSYIFSQTIFNLRSGVDTRLAGAATCCIFLAMAASPASVISYLPRAFFGSLLVMISIDLMVEWLWQARLRMMPAEYMVCLATFGAIQACGVEEGMAAGLVLAALSFTITYAQVPRVMTARVKASTVMRTFEERVILQAHRQQTLVLELQGYIFFGSATKILTDVKERIVWGVEQRGDVASANTTLKRDGGNYGLSPASRSPKSPSPPAGRSRLPSARWNRPRPYLSSNAVRSARRNPLSPTLSPVYNRSGIRPFPDPSKSWASESGLALWSRSRGYLRREREEQQQKQQQQTGYAAATGKATTFGPSGGRVWPVRMLSSEGRDGRQTRERGTTEDSIIDTSIVDGSGGTDGTGGAEGLRYGAGEDGVNDGYDSCSSERDGGGLRERESRDRAAMDGVVQTYMSLWANGDFPATDGSPLNMSRSHQSSSVTTLLPRSEQRTRRVVLDFSNVVGVDATAARSCFLMLKMMLRTSRVEMVFSGANRKVQSLLKSHGVITEDDGVFDSLDTALEWSEEMVLNERKNDMLRRRVISENGRSAGRAASSWSGVNPSPLALPRPMKPSEAPAPRAVENHLREDDGHHGARNNGGMSPMLASTSERVEAAAFLGHHEDYYARAGSLRRKSSKNRRIAHAGGEDGVMAVGDVGSLQCILEDYLEVDRYQVPESIRNVLREAHRFFKQESVAANAVLMNAAVPSEKLFFIGAGSVELQIVGDSGPKRLLKVCAGGTFGEVGFYLNSPQAFRGITLETCHLHTLDRKGMAKMQRENPGLCVLVQKAVLKSVCLAASFSIDSAHLGPIDSGGAGHLESVAEEEED